MIVVGYCPTAQPYTFSASDRASFGVGVPALMVNSASGNRCYQGYLAIDTGGTIKGYYYNYNTELINSALTTHLFWATFVYFVN